MSDDVTQIEQQLEELDRKSEEHFQKCEIRSAMRIAREATRLAKGHSLVIHYMRGLFDQMRFGHGLLDPQATREVSVELVLLLQDEEQARRIQPNLDEGHYQWLCSWMSTCAYDNLAEATGMMSGFNSTGMHACITDGIQVCRQTGKMECVKCFREYAADVYLAADDLDMVRHQCQSLLDYRKESGDNKDRRWSAHHKQGRISLLEGRAEVALEELEQALQLSQAEDVYLKLRSRLMVACALDEARLLAGQTRFDWSTVEEELPAGNEWPYWEMQRACADALAATLSGDWNAAIEILTEWDRRLTEQKCRKEWFEVRLRLIAAYLLNGNRKRAEALAKGLEATADESQDFLTLRRMQQLLASEGPVSPIAALNSPFSSSVEGLQAAEPRSEHVDDDEVDAVAEEESVTPLGEVLADYMQRIMQTQGDEVARMELLQTFLSHQPESVKDPQDAAYLVHLSQFIVRGTEDALQVWPWACGLLDAFPDDAITMSVVASMGHYFRVADPTAFASISMEQLENWFRLSTSSQVQHAKNFLRAATFYADEGNSGEAERCYSRAFRLNRTDASIVLPLADLYRLSDRPRDALAVLDLSLREGNQDQAVAWEAAMTAVQLEQYDTVLTYIDKFLELGDAQAWTHYYRAFAFFQLGRYEDSLTELQQDYAFDLPGDFHLTVLKLSNLIALDQQDQIPVVFETLLNMPLSAIDYLSLNQIVRLVGELWNTLQHWPQDHPLRLRLEMQMLQAGLLTDEYFETIRLAATEEKLVHLYHVQIHQPLDANWSTSVGCLPGQADWTDYECEWGVLATDEQQAVDFVLNYQSQCSVLPAEVIDVQTDEEQYRDRPGVVWQGLRWSQMDESDELSAEEFDDELD